MKTSFIYSEAFSRFDLGPEHPLKPIRLKLTYEMIKACGLLSPDDARLIEPVMADEQDLLSFHTPDYIGILKAVNNGRPVPGSAFFGLGPGDNPVFPGVFDASRLIAGGSLLAASLVESGSADIAFNIGGGLHHATASSASGFCYVNDPVLAIRSLVQKGRKVAYIDIDAHHGDGVQEAFYTTGRVLTISLHETGDALFPGTGFEHETGEGDGAGYSVNIPLPPESDDELFLHAFDESVPLLIEAFKPDIVVSQLGVDSFRGDPLAHLNYTTNGFCEAVRKIKAMAPKWVALGGGGYDADNVARAWTLAWAIMNDQEAPDDVPEFFIRRYGKSGVGSVKLRDVPYRIAGRDKELMMKEADRVIGCIKENVIRKIKS